MEITWQGHSSLRLVSRDVALLTDPFPNSPSGAEAHIVAISNDYPNHSTHESVGGEPRLISGPGQYEVMGYNITGIGTALNDAPDSRRINTVYVIRSEGLAVCFLGNLNARLTSRQQESLGSVDVLIVPAGRRKHAGSEGYFEAGERAESGSGDTCSLSTRTRARTV